MATQLKQGLASDKYGPPQHAGSRSSNIHRRCLTSRYSTEVWHLLTLRTIQANRCMCASGNLASNGYQTLGVAINYIIMPLVALSQRDAAPQLLDMLLTLRQKHSFFFFFFFSIFITLANGRIINHYGDNAAPAKAPEVKQTSIKRILRRYLSLNHTWVMC